MNPLSSPAITLTLPLQIKASSSLNGRQHHYVRAQRVRTQRQALRLAWNTQAKHKHPRLPLIIRMTRIAPNRMDDDNLAGAFKSIRDELAACLKLDDRTPFIHWRYAMEKGAVREYGVRVEIICAACERCGGDAELGRTETGFACFECPDATPAPDRELEQLRAQVADLTRERDALKAALTDRGAA